MNRLTLEEIKIVLSQYIGCKVKDTLLEWSGEKLLINEVNDGICLLLNQGILKLLLIPLVELTNEDAIVIGKIAGWSHLSDEGLIANVKELMCTNKLFNQQTNIAGFTWFKIHHYLLSKGYAAPLFFVDEHWANGMNALELELAITK